MRRTSILIAVLLSLLFVSCMPSILYPPYPNPDDVQEYESLGYHSVTYIYKCYQGQYMSFTYVNEGYGWILESTFTSSGICD